MPDSSYFMTHYNTKLTPAQRVLFALWADRHSRALGRNLLADMADYDLRGYWLSGDRSTDGHFPDKWKKPNHPTFSDESVYHGARGRFGEVYRGGQWTGNDQNGWSFSPSPEMLRYTHTPAALQEYFQQYEPDATLMMPQ